MLIGAYSILAEMAAHRVRVMLTPETTEVGLLDSSRIIAAVAYLEVSDGLMVARDLLLKTTA